MLRHHKKQPRNNKMGRNTHKRPPSRKPPPNVQAEEKVTAEKNQVATDGVPGTSKPHANAGAAHKKKNNVNNPQRNPGPRSNYNREIRLHRRAITRLLRERKRVSRTAMLSNITPQSNSSSEEVNLSGYKSDQPTDSEKRQLLYIGGAIGATLQLARGWYAAIRKAGIAFGPRSYNDKFFFDQMPRTTQDPEEFNILTSHTLTINFLQQVLIANFNHLLVTDTKRHLTRLPHHISFALNVMVNKYILRVRNGVVNLATRLPMPIPNKRDPETNIPVENEYVEPTQWMTEVNNNIHLSLLFAIQQHKAYPFHTVENLTDKLTGILVHDQHGNATPSDMHIHEIVSVYGYSTKKEPGTSTTGEPRGDGKYFYDLSGLVQNSITNIFRTFFFPTFLPNYSEQTGPGFDLSKYLPDDFNERKLDTLFFDNEAYAVYFGMTGKVSTADYCFTATLPRFNTEGDFVNDQPIPSESGQWKSVTNQGLDYLETKYKSNATMPDVYSSEERSVPAYPTVVKHPAFYNLALQLAQALQSPYQPFAQRPAGSRAADITYGQYLNHIYSHFFDPFNEASMDFGVFCVQYNNRFVLPTPIAEQCKAINSYNTWSYKDSSQSVTVQLMLTSATLHLVPNTLEKKLKYNGSFFHLKAAANLPDGWSIWNMNGTDGSGYWEKYDGTEFRPYNFERILAASDKYLNELRPYVKLCNVPEREMPLPSMHVMYRSILPEIISPEGAPPIRVQSIYTPLDYTTFADKSMEIFIKYTYMPNIEIPDGCNIPLLNITNSTTTFEDEVFFNLYQMSFVASYDGPSSEMDMYYSELRKRMIGAWSDLLPMLGNVASSFLGGNGGGQLTDIVQNVMGIMGGQSPFNKVFDLLAHPAVQHAAPQMGMLGDLLSMFGTPIRNMTNYDQNGFVSTNIAPPPPEQKPEKKSFWSTLGDIALTAAPMLLTLL